MRASSQACSNSSGTLKRPKGNQTRQLSTRSISTSKNKFRTIRIRDGKCKTIITTWNRTHIIRSRSQMSVPRTDSCPMEAGSRGLANASSFRPQPRISNSSSSCLGELANSSSRHRIVAFTSRGWMTNGTRIWTRAWSSQSNLRLLTGIPISLGRISLVLNLPRKQSMK